MDSALGCAMEIFAALLGNPKRYSVFQSWVRAGVFKKVLVDLAGKRSNGASFDGSEGMWTRRSLK